MGSIQDHIKALNFAYRVQCRESAVDYVNALGRVLGEHHVETRDSQGQVRRCLSTTPLSTESDGQALTPPPPPAPLLWT